MPFIDRVTIQVRGGHGGAGVSAFKRQKGRPRGKPTGGSGGGGGSVSIRASQDEATLSAYYRQTHWRAGDGSHGEGELRHGKAGADVVLDVPLGTLVYDAAGTLLADLVEPGQQALVAEGGKGGRGNAAFVTRHRKAPSYAEQGEFGADVALSLELKLIADAALVGFPNAGKSTLIARVSAAKPKIADYPFTTLEPNLGVVSLGDRSFTLADIPGLIEGAAEGKGLGHEFLRHVERARALVVLLDPSSLQVEPIDRQYTTLLTELGNHSPELLAVPRIVAINKLDIAEESRTELVRWATSLTEPVAFVSAATGEGCEALMFQVADLVEAAARQAPDREGYQLHRPLPAGFAVVREGSEWVVTGRSAERAVRFSDLTVPEAADMASRRLTRLGVDEALRNAGAVPGDDVRIGDIVFTFDPEDAELIEGEG